MGFVSVKTHTPAATEFMFYGRQARMAAGIVRHTALIDTYVSASVSLVFALRRDQLDRDRPPHCIGRRSTPGCLTLLAALEDQLQLLELLRGVIRRAKARGGLLVFARVVIARLPQARSIMRCAARVTRRRSASGDKGRRLPLLSRCSAPICAIST